MKTNKVVSIILLIVIVAILVFATVYKVVNNHEDKLILVSEKRISEAAEKCILEEKCNGEEVALSTLISEGYLKKEIHPITKEYIDGSLKINCKNEKCECNID